MIKAYFYFSCKDVLGPHPLSEAVLTALRSIEDQLSIRSGHQWSSYVEEGSGTFAIHQLSSALLSHFEFYNPISFKGWVTFCICGILKSLIAVGKKKKKGGVRSQFFSC
jgi:hypothetical protein